MDVRDDTVQYGNCSLCGIAIGNHNHSDVTCRTPAALSQGGCPNHSQDVGVVERFSRLASLLQECSAVYHTVRSRTLTSGETSSKHAYIETYFSTSKTMHER